MFHVIIVYIEAIEKYLNHNLYNNNYRATITYKDFPRTYYYKDISYGHITSSDIFRRRIKYLSKICPIPEWLMMIFLLEKVYKSLVFVIGHIPKTKLHKKRGVIL